MKDFIFTLPTKLYFGESYIEKVGSILKEKSFKNVLIVFGNHSKKVGLIDNIEMQLKEENIKYFELDDIRVNPIRSKVYEGIKIAKDNNVDLILAIGGGSVIDTAKAIACGAKVNFCCLWLVCLATISSSRWWLYAELAAITPEGLVKQRVSPWAEVIIPPASVTISEAAA